jgi:hypothetical protein
VDAPRFYFDGNDVDSDPNDHTLIDCTFKETYHYEALFEKKIDFTISHKPRTRGS